MGSNFIILGLLYFDSDGQLMLAAGQGSRLAPLYRIMLEANRVSALPRKSVLIKSMPRASVSPRRRGRTHHNTL